MKSILPQLALFASPFLLMAAFLDCSQNNLLWAQEPVELAEKIEAVPTYPFGLADKNPIFYTGRVYQGAQGHVYPYAMRDILSNEKQDELYRLLYLENEYVKLGIAPDLGGRIFQATDKTSGYEFFYRQHVVKPALIGMLGAWISGGVEWNVPHHHRPSSLMSIDWATGENEDGSKVVYVGETEIRHRMRWNAALKLYPGKSLVEAKITVENRSPFAQSILSWANVSVHCNDDYQVIFAPSVQFGTGHSKIDFNRWPIDNGVDISMWTNHNQHSRSVFAWDFESDFLAGYDFGADAGTTHVGNRHVVGGKKFFLWGNHPRAQVWDEALTDDDGPYLELMVGGWSDNQPDYSWIGPNETRRYKHYWFPISKIKHVKNANLNGAVNLERTSDSEFFLGFSPTEAYSQARLTLSAGDGEIWSQIVDVAPGNSFVADVALSEDDAKRADSEFTFSVKDADGDELIAYTPVVLEEEDLPEPVAPFGNPKDYKTNEELYLAGLRLEQFHNGQRDPMEFYNEALARDPGDARVNTAVGVRVLREGKFAQAAEYLETALQRLEKGYTRVKDGEPHYYLALAYRGLGRDQDAEDQLWKAAWTTGYQAAAFYQLAELAAKQAKYAEALELIDRSLAVNTDDAKAIVFKAWTIRKILESGSAAEDQTRLVAGNRLYQTADVDKNVAKELLESAVKRNPLDYAAALELGFLNGEPEKAFAEVEKSRGVVNDRPDSATIRQQELLETVVEYANRGAWDEASSLLDAALDFGKPFANISTIWYYKGWALLNKTGDCGMAQEAFQRAATLSNEYVFAFRTEERALFDAVLDVVPNDPQARYEYGMLLYYFNDKEEALEQWRESARLRPNFGRVWRNIGFAEGQKRNYDAALDAYRTALTLIPDDPRFIYEYDQLAASAGRTAAERLADMEPYADAVFQYDDCVARLVELYNAAGNYDKSLDVLANRHFHVWEGGRDVHSLFVDAALLRGMKRLEEKDYAGAVDDFQKAATYPKNFEAAPPIGGGQNAKIYYLIALAFDKQGDEDAARQAYEACADPKNAPNSLRSEPTYYRVLGMRKLGKDDEAAKLSDEFAKQVADEAARTPTIDEFSKFGEEGTSAQRSANSFFQQGLAARLKGDRDGAAQAFDAAAKLNPNLIWAPVMKNADLD